MSSTLAIHDMGSLYLTDLANWLRGAGLHVIEYDDWQRRSRSSGGYDQFPLCVMWHHTASPPSWNGQRDADYLAVGDEDSPVSNLYIDRQGTVWVLAGGATNTNGKGRSLTFSRGTVPNDSMNTRALGVEMGNNGTGETWPQAQLDSMFAVSNVCNLKFGNGPTDLSTHQNYAPDRKIDPATAAAVQGPWKPRSINSSGTWHNGDIQTECERRWFGTDPNPPDNEGEYVRLFDGLWQRDNHDAVFAIYADGTKKWQTDPGMLNATVALETLNGATSDQVTVKIQSDPGMFAAFGLVVGPNPPGCDEWGNYVG